MRIPDRMRRIGRIASRLMWFPLLTLIGLPSGEYAWSELPLRVRYGMAASGLLFGTSMLMLAVVPVVTRILNRIILARGLPAKATILEVSDTGSQEKEIGPIMRMQLEVETAGGVPFRAETERSVPHDEIEQLKPGEEVQVRYDPANGEVAVIDE